MSSKINLQLATRLPLLLYRFCFVSPVIRLPNGTYTCSSWMVAYYVIATIAYLLYILFRYPTHRAFIPTIVQHFGHIWVALLLVDIFLSKATFILIVSMALYYAHHQMEFFNTVREIDICLHRHFAHVPLRYDRMFVLYICIVLVIWMICGTGAWFKWMHLQAMQRIGTTIPGDFVMITFVVEKLNLWMLTCAFVGCAIVVRERMCVLVTAMRLERVRPGAEQPQEPALEFGNVVELHRRLCRLVELMSIYAGGIMLLRFVHDFVLVTAYTYFLCDMLLHHDVSVLAGLPSVWNLLQNFARPVMVCVSAELVQEAVKFCDNCVVYNVF